MKLYVKRIFMIAIVALWFGSIACISFFIKDNMKYLLTIGIFVLLSALLVTYFYLTNKENIILNSVLNAFANREKRTFIFQINYKTSNVYIYNDKLDVEHKMRLKNFARRYLGIVENSKEYVALVVGKLDFDYYNKTNVKVVENNQEKFYNFKCLVTQKNILWGSIEQVEE